MEKTKRAQAVKKLEAELKDEKVNEIKRRREITLERKKAAEEKERIEADKAKVCRTFPSFCLASEPGISDAIILRSAERMDQILTQSLF